MKALSLLICLIGLATLTFGQKYKKKHLIWADEFKGTGLPDDTKWSFDTQGNATGWGNNEKQFYTTEKPSNAYVKKGYLHIVAKKEKRESKDYTSARLITSKKFSFIYGRIDVRAKLPQGRGTWPAIWMLGENIGTKGWPECGEIDIMEHVGYEPDSLYGTVHTEAYNHVRGTQMGKAIYLPEPYSKFHVYSVDWNKDRINFLLDGKVYHTFRNDYKSEAEWPFDHPFYIILNLAVGGNWGGKNGIDDSIFPQTFVIDYVRVYQNSDRKN